jgi:hypothetical protein
MANESNLLYWVVSARMKGMTFENTYDGHPERFEQAFFLKGLDGIFRACRCEPAGWRQHRRECAFVQSKESNKKTVHIHGAVLSCFRSRSTVRLRTVSTAFMIRSCPAVTSSRRPTNTRSYPCVRSRSVLITQARICRLSLFLVTELASFLPTVMPTLKLPVSFPV